MAASSTRSLIPATLALVALIGAPLAWTPTVIRGLAAFAWVSHYAAMESLPHPHRAAAKAIASRIDAAIVNLAPLPQASEAARRGLEIAQRAQYSDHDREAALLIYQGIRASCARVRDRPLSGPGFAVIEARAAALENALRAELPK
jgi:hypothetical protein